MKEPKPLSEQDRLSSDVFYAAGAAAREMGMLPLCEDTHSPPKFFTTWFRLIRRSTKHPYNSRLDGLTDAEIGKILDVGPWKEPPGGPSQT